VAAIAAVAAAALEGVAVGAGDGVVTCGEENVCDPPLPALLPLLAALVHEEGDCHGEPAVTPSSSRWLQR
jgi:hypothetical protein